MPERRAGLPRAIIGGGAIIVGFTGALAGVYGASTYGNEGYTLVAEYPSLYETASAQDQIHTTLRELLSQVHEDVLRPSALQRETLRKAQQVIDRANQQKQIMQSESYQVADQKFVGWLYTSLLSFCAGIAGISLFRR